MNFTFAIILSLILFVGLVAAYFHRGVFILLMLLPASQFLGFLDPMTIAIKGVFDIHALILILILIAIFTSISRWPDLRETAFLMPMVIFALLWLYGVLYPVMKGYSSLFYAIKGSKEFLTIFSYFAVFFYLRNEKEVRFGWYVVIGLGIYYSILEMVAQAMGTTLLSNMVYVFRKELFFWKLYPPFWPVILIAFLHAYYEHTFAVRHAFLRMGVTSVGLLLTFFRSYLLATVVSVPLLLFLSRLGMMRTLGQGFVVAITISFSIVGIALTIDKGHDSLGALSENFVFSGIEEFGSQTGGALAGREVFAKDRRAILKQSPYFGFGFIDKDSKFGRVVIKHITGDLLGFIDKGDVDTALKFGYVGRIVLYGTALYLVYLLIRLVRARLTPSISVRALTAATIVIVFLLVQPVHAALTYSFSLLPLGIVLGLLERERLIHLRLSREHQK